MKYLTDYTQQAQTELFNETGAFWAFGDKQFEEKKKEGVTYVTIPYLSGCICPKNQVKRLVDGLIEIGEKARKQDMEENGREAIIKRELYNHECFYTGCVDDAVETLAPYGITPQEVRAMYVKELPNSDL